MLDFILGLFLAALLIRGWVRGLVREALDLVGLIAGIFIAFRLSGPLGDFLVDTFGVSPEVGTIGGGILLFVLFGVSLSIGAHYLTKVMTLPGLNLVNRVGGSVVATVWAVALLLVIINLARVMPLPDGLHDAVEESTVVEVIAGRDAVPQSLFVEIGSDQVLESLASIRSIFDSARAVPEGNEVLTIPAAPRDEIRQARGRVAGVIEMMNEFRAGEGLRALAASDGYTAVAEDRATAMYRAGRLSREDGDGNRAGDALLAARLPFAVSGENIALASSTRAAFDGMLDSSSARAQLSVAGYDRVGVSVVNGPTGLLVVIVFGG